MNIETIEGVKDIEVITVTLAETSNKSSYKMWNCPACLKPIFRYKGSVISVSPGVVPDKIPFLNQCSDCRQDYLIIKTFITVSTTEATTVVLVETTNNSDWKMWHCNTCRSPLFRHKGKLVSLSPGYVPSEIPVQHQCSNTRCKQNYLIEKILSRATFLENKK